MGSFFSFSRLSDAGLTPILKVPPFRTQILITPLNPQTSAVPGGQPDISDKVLAGAAPSSRRSVDPGFRVGIGRSRLVYFVLKFFFLQCFQIVFVVGMVAPLIWLLGVVVLSLLS